MHILFICSANKDRSATAEDVAREYYPEHEYDSAGTNQKICFQYSTQYISLEKLNWADLVMVMENKHKKSIIKTFGSSHGKRIKVLHIRDQYEYGNATLKEMIKEKLNLIVKPL